LSRQEETDSGPASAAPSLGRVSVEVLGRNEPDNMWWHCVEEESQLQDVPYTILQLDTRGQLSEVDDDSKPSGSVATGGNSIILTLDGIRKRFKPLQTFQALTILKRSPSNLRDSVTVGGISICVGEMHSSNMRSSIISNVSCRVTDLSPVHRRDTRAPSLQFVDGIGMLANDCNSKTIQVQ
jgi:hypothetical protein